MSVLCNLQNLMVVNLILLHISHSIFRSGAILPKVGDFTMGNGSEPKILIEERGGIKMRHMFKYISISLLFLLAFAGCATAVQQESVHYYNIYDEQGKRKGYLKESGGNITIYDENWKRKGQLK